MCYFIKTKGKFLDIKENIGDGTDIKFQLS